MNETRDLIIGIDFGKEYSQICCYDRKAGEPRSLPVKVGTSQYETPTLLCRRKDHGEFCIGLEAEYFAREKGGFLIDHLFELTDGEEGVQIEGEEKKPWELLAGFIHEMLKFVGVMDIVRNTACLAITMETLNARQLDNLKKACKSLGFSEKRCMFLDYEECFFYHVMTQKLETWNRSVAWYDFDQDHVSFRKMVIGSGQKPAPVHLEEKIETDLPEEGEERDAAFAAFIRETLGTDLYSSIQISGEGFGQEWAEKSVRILCFQRRKVFFGNNLFAGGACAAGAERFIARKLQDYRFMSSALVLTDVGMDMRIMGAPAYYPLIEAGTNWYECSASCEMILDHTKELVFVVAKAGEEEKKRISMPLPGLPQRPDKTTRLLLQMEYVSQDTLCITVRDLGFGEMFPSSGKVWRETAQW